MGTVQAVILESVSWSGFCGGWGFLVGLLRLFSTIGVMPETSPACPQKGSLSSQLRRQLAPCLLNGAGHVSSSMGRYPTLMGCFPVFASLEKPVALAMPNFGLQGRDSLLQQQCVPVKIGVHVLLCCPDTISERTFISSRKLLF